MSAMLRGERLCCLPCSHPTHSRRSTWCWSWQPTMLFIKVSQTSPPAFGELRLNPHSSVCAAHVPCRRYQKPSAHECQSAAGILEWIPEFPEGCSRFSCGPFTLAPSATGSMSLSPLSKSGGWLVKLCRFSSPNTALLTDNSEWCEAFSWTRRYGSW